MKILVTIDCKLTNLNHNGAFDITNTSAFKLLDVLGIVYSKAQSYGEGLAFIPEYRVADDGEFIDNSVYNVEAEHDLIELLYLCYDAANHTGDKVIIDEMNEEFIKLNVELGYKK